MRILLHKSPENLNVSVVLPVHNCASVIGNCIESILRQIHPIQDIIIVDDGSTDNTPLIVSKYPVRLLSVRRSGKAKAENLALTQVKGDLIWIAEGDAQYPPDFLEKMVKPFSDPQVAGVLPGPRIPSNSNRNFWVRCQEAEFQVRWLELKEPLAAWVYRKEVLDEAGGFDEDALHDDWVMGIKVKALGYKLVFQPDSIWFHHEKETLWQIFRQQFRWGTAHIQSLRKYKRMPRGIAFNSLFLGLLIISLVFRAFSFFAFLVVCALAIFSYVIIRYVWFARKIVKDIKLCMGVPFIRVFRSFSSTLGFFWGVILYLSGKDPFQWILNHG